MSFMNRFPDKPLIYNIVWKTFMYILATLVVRYVENIRSYYEILNWYLNNEEEKQAPKPVLAIASPVL